MALVKAGLVGALGALVGVLVTFLLGDAVSGPLMVTQAGADVPEEVALGAALSATVVGAIAATILAAICRQALSNPIPAFVGVCVVVLVAYGIFTFSASEEVATAIWLNVMHVAAALPIMGLLVPAMSAVRSAEDPK